jgi:hypothetical protein
MGYKDKEKQRAYARQWMANRRNDWFKDKVCVDCGTTSRLELDHVDPSQKVDHRVWSWAYKRRYAELDKCVARCIDCHKVKSYLTRKHKADHGTSYMWRRGCRCQNCLFGRAADKRKWRANKRKREQNMVAIV